MLEINKIYNGEALEILKTFPDESIDCIVTSPPYWMLRDYGVDNQIGLEKTFDEYINKLCDIFDEIKRVLKKDGTCWVNIGDTYNNSSWANKQNKFEHQPIDKKDKLAGRGGQLGYQDKCLCQIPSRFSIEMINRGWILRNEIIWHKPACMPSSATDRFTVDFEKIFFFVKNKNYWFEQQYESYVQNSDMEYRKKLRCGRKYAVKRPYKDNQPLSYIKTLSIVNPNGRNKRTIWKVNTKPYKDAHFATYPEKLIETPIKAGCPENGIVLDPFMGAGTTGLTAKKLNRNYIGIELNKDYCDIANKRIDEYTSQLKLF